MESHNSGPQLPRIRIVSELKGPEAVVIDTSRPVVPPPATQDDTGKPVAPLKPQLALNVSQLASPSSAQNDAREPSKVAHEPQPRSNLGQAHAGRRPMSYAQRPEPGLFDAPWTFDQRVARVRDSFAQIPRQPRQRTRREGVLRGSQHMQRMQFGWFNTGW